MRHLRNSVGTVLLLMLPTAAQAGLYYSGEPMAELPSQWRGFLRDQKALRSIAVKPAPGKPASPLRERYFALAEKLEKSGKDRKLTAEEKADLGAIYVRLGESSKAVALLRTAQREYPKDFAIAANLGTALQTLGDLKQAQFALQEAVRLAPEKWQKAEQLHLKLVSLRLQKKGLAELEDLFGVRWIADNGAYVPGKLAEDQRKKLPEDAVGLVQQLALWLPADGPLLWQLAEMANMYGDFTTAAAIMEGCVTQFGMQSKELGRRRQLTQEAIDARTEKGEHDAKASTFKPLSKQPLLAKLDESLLPPINPKGVNAVPWTIISETSVDRKFRPSFANYLKDLDGKQVSLVGFMQALGGEQELTMFMFIENPVGCWYCEMPEPTEIVFVELPNGKSTQFIDTMVRVTGRLVLNSSDPEEFLYTIRDAKVAEVD
jgi:tetratricopeptide (TPR) repeat protein